MIRVQRLVWDDWNVGHVARHEVAPEEVEQVCHSNPMASSVHSGRLRLVGSTLGGRLLTVILAGDAKAGVCYPVTARPASKRERQHFEAWQGEVGADG